METRNQRSRASRKLGKRKDGEGNGRAKEVWETVKGKEKMEKVMGELRKCGKQ